MTINTKREKKPSKQKPASPLPMRDGVSSSRVWLPKCGILKQPGEFYGHWDTVLDFLLERFPFIPEDILRERLALGGMVDQHGTPYAADTPYPEASFLFYYREIPDEPRIPFQETILFKNDHLIVVDKPHFIPVTPIGRFVKESLLSRLKHRFQIEAISPIHRLDRETAGVMLFSCDADFRGPYQNLFQNREVRKTYEAIAPNIEREYPFIYRSNIVPSEPFFLQKEAPGEPNAETLVDRVEVKGDLARYRLKPVTGRQHQLRIHMTALGCPILNDPFYPELLANKGEDYSAPLQLLAKTLEFTDPITGEPQFFESQLRLEL